MTAATFAAPNGIATLATSLPITSAASAGDDEPQVRLTVTAPPFVEPGSTHELVVGIAAPRRARWVELTISADPDLLELRDATPSAWGGRRSAAPDFEARLGAW